MKELNKEKAKSRASLLRFESKELRLKKLEGDYQLIKDNIVKHNAIKFQK